MTAPNRSAGGRLKLAVRAALVALGYAALAELSYRLFRTTPAAPVVVWLPIGFTLAALIRSDVQSWPALLLAILAAATAVEHAHGQPLPVALGWGLANALDPLFGALFTRRVLPPWTTLSCVRDVLAFLALGALLGPIPGSVVAAFASGLCPSWPNCLHQATGWWASEAIGIALTGPLFLGVTPAFASHPPPLRILEAVALLAALLGVTEYVFGEIAPAGMTLPLPYATFPFIIWAALRFGVPEVAVAIALMAGLAAWHVSAGHGPFIGTTYEDRVLGVQVFFSVVSVSGLVLAAALTERARLYEDAQRAIRLRDDFLALASHELRTPLTPLSLLLGSMDHGLRAGRPVGAPELQRVRRYLDRVVALIEDLLDASRAARGQLTLRVGPLSLRAVVEDAAAMWGSARHPLTLEVPDDEVRVVGDRDRLLQVMANLLGNAIKYSPEGGPVGVSLGVLGSEARIIVRDRGIGIPTEQQGRLFERYFRATNAPIHSYGGMGLGLYICRDVVERHGGHIWVESAEGEGSAFHVALPLLKEGSARRERSGDS